MDVSSAYPDVKRLQVLENAIKYRDLQVQGLDARGTVPTTSRLIGNELSRRHANGLLWDVIYLIAHGEYAGEDVGVTDLYLSLGVSKGTALRALDRLIELDCVEKRRHPKDSRRTNLHLVQRFREGFEKLLDEMIDDAWMLHHLEAR